MDCNDRKRLFSHNESAWSTCSKIKLDSDFSGTCPLISHDVILSHTLSYLSVGHYIYVASVSKRWREAYFKEIRGPWPECTLTFYKNALSSSSCLEYASKYGLDIIRLMSDENDQAFPLLAGTYASACMLRWLKSRGITWHEEISRGACSAGRLELLQWMIEDEGCKWSKNRVAQTAASSGHIDILNWLWNKPELRWSSENCYVSNSAALAGQTDVLKWLASVGALVDEQLSHAAASGGKLGTLQWLKTQPIIDFGTTALGAAAQAGYFEVFMWLVDPNGGNCEIGSSACIDATFGGSVELLRWLKERGEGSWESNDMRAMLQLAGLNQSLPMVKWLRQQGAPWPVGFHAIAITAQRSSAPLPPLSSLSRPKFLSFMCWRLESLKWAISEGSGWGMWSLAVCRGLRAQPFAGVNYTPELEWAHANGCPCTCDCFPIN